MTEFSNFTLKISLYAYPFMVINPNTREEVPGAVAVQREAENAGTFILNDMGAIIAYVANHHHVNGEWLYYSSDVHAAFIT